jgi:hypothetical protein
MRAIMLLVIVIAVAAVLMLPGCIGVSQDKYDSLAKSCDQEKKALTDSVALEKANCAQSAGALSKCSSDKSALETLVANKDSQIASMQEGANAIAQARMKTAKITQYQLALAYYEDAFGVGKIPNTPKMNKIDTQVRSLSDPALYAAWLSVKNCGGISDCLAAKQNFTDTIDARVSALSDEVVGIVRVK